jgi:hypothetical protein
VKTLSGSSLILWVEGTDTIETVKRQIICTLGWIFSQPRDVILVIDGIQLGDARTLRECGITAGTQLTMIMRLRGGVGSDLDSDSLPDLDSFETFDDALDNDPGSSVPEVSRRKK